MSTFKVTESFPYFVDGEIISYLDHIFYYPDGIDYRWIATDEDGTVSLFTDEPEFDLRNEVWINDIGLFEEIGEVRYIGDVMDSVLEIRGLDKSEKV